ncbi:MAG: winged helix-turn-helix transcriptional regulator [Deltaproteobacteria bacterium]|uniref:Winged helix-turn-helix transcriptional regulator n=1 Tax=Candidatus Zymogenus saltonus TaxID=2844893 RepID=A0A9D8KIX7_9DELT|nr:winged helix-turn-helix transcriptional regulator [Candidatus Zymogenus saltonus]
MRTFMAETFKAFGVESRIKIIELLKEKGPMGVNELSETLGITPSAVSQHLKVLKFTGLVKNQRQGCCVPYEVNIDALDNCREMISKVCSCKMNCMGMAKETGADRIDRLRRYEGELLRELEEVRSEIADTEGTKGEV